MHYIIKRISWFILNRDDPIDDMGHTQKPKTIQKQNKPDHFFCVL